MHELPVPSLRRPPTGLARRLFRAPIALYRWRLGWLLDDRFLLLHHVGRRTGQPRQAVVEVLRHDTITDTYIIASGFGRRAQWFRNIQAKPAISIQVGRRTLAVTATVLPPAAAAAELARYATAHPRAARALGRFLGFNWDGSAARAAELAHHIPILALRPRAAAEAAP